MNTNMQQLIKNYVLEYKVHRRSETSWREPIVGFADPRDPMFLELKNIVGAHHALPTDIIHNAKSVIAFFLPFSEEIVESNLSGAQSSRAWDIANIETNALIEDLNKFLYEKIVNNGFSASLLPATYNYDKEKLTSDWSHRSVGYICGIGTFGIHNMLITKSGCCGRFGSIVTDMEFISTPRTGVENCLYKYNSSCKKCLDRCVNNAFQLDSQGKVYFDRYKCNKQIYERVIPKYDIGLGDTCGKCMVGLPCSQTSPKMP